MYLQDSHSQVRVTHGKILMRARVWLFGPKILASPSASYSRVHSWSALKFIFRIELYKGTDRLTNITERRHRTIYSLTIYSPILLAHLGTPRHTLGTPRRRLRNTSVHA